MSTAQKLSKIGLADFAGRLFDHRWDDPSELIVLGELSAATVGELTAGLIEQPVAVSVNKLLAPGVYDTVLVFGATVPHEVAGFAGGAKYFFPGVAGPELTHTTHWLGALAGIENIIGEVETPTRKLIEAAADLIAAVITANVIKRTLKHLIYLTNQGVVISAASVFAMRSSRSRALSSGTVKRNSRFEVPCFWVSGGWE